MSFSLVVGTEDVTSYVRNGATFTEVASSPEGQALLTLTGSHTEAVVGASVTLSSSGVIAWEGTVTSSTQQLDPQTGFVLATMIAAAPLSAQLNVAAQYAVTAPTDGAQVASALAGIAGVPWSGPSNYGVAIGALNISRLSDGVTAAATIVGRTWSVRNGSLTFTGAMDAAPTAVATTFSTLPQTANGIHVTGGIDAISRQPLQGSAQPPGSPEGAIYHLAAPMLADAPTLSTYATAIAERYAPGAVVGVATLPIGSPVIRAGDYIIDQQGVATVAYATRTTLTAGQYINTVSLGYPALGTTPAYDSALFQAASQYPVARLHDGYVVQGGDLTAAGLAGSLDALTMVLGGQTVTLAAGPLTLPANATFAVVATATEYAIDLDPTTPFPGEALALWAVTTNESEIVGQVDLRTHGSVGIANVQSNTYPAPVASSPTGDAVDGISGLTTDVTVTATFTNIPAENTAAEVAWYFRTAGGTTWSVWGSTVIPGLPQPASSQTLSFDFTALPNGGAFDFGAAYKGLRSDTGPIAVVLADFATGALAVPSGDGPPMPSTIKTNGPDVTSASLGAAVGLGSGSFAQPFSVTVGDWTAGNNPTWFVELLFYKRQHGDTNAIPVGAISANKTGLSYTSTADLPASSTGWDIGVAYLDASGQASAIVWPAALNAADAPLQPPAIATGTYPTPTTSSVNVTIEGVSPASCDVIVTPVFTNIPASPANGIHWYARTSGTTAWGLRGVTALSASSFKFAALVNGAEYDFGAAYGGLRSDDVGSIAVLESNVVASNIANEFGGSLNADGSWSNVDGHSTTTSYTIGTPQPVIIAGTIQKGVTTSPSALILGNSTNGYGVGLDASGNVFIGKWVASTFTSLASVAYVNDTNPHSFRLTISNSGGTNYIEGTIDQHALSATDTSLTLTTGTWPVTVYTGGNAGKLSHYAFAATSQHFGGLPVAVQNPLIPPWDAGYSDGSTLRSGLLFGRHMNGAPANDSGALFNGSTMLQSRHDPAVLTGSVTGIVKNLVPDSEFMFGLGNGYWHTASAISISPQDGGGSGNMAYYQQGSTAGSAGYQYFISAQMYLQSGLTYNLSGFINAANVTSGGVIWGIYDPTVSTQYASVAQTAGVSGRVNANFTVPTTGYYVLIGDTSVVDVSANGLIIWSEPQITYSSYPLAYRPNIGTTAWNQNYWPYTIHHPSLTGGVFQRNLVVNGNNTSGTAALAPEYFGWKSGYAGGTCTSAGTYNLGSLSLPSIQLTCANNSGVYQIIPVTPGQTYTFCTLAYSETGGQARLWIGSTAFNVQFNVTPGTPSGSLGAFYAGATGSIVSSEQAAGGDAWQVLYGTFTVPAGSYEAAVLLQNVGGTSGTVFFLGVQVIQGTRLQDYIDHELNPGAVDLSRHITTTPLPYANNAPAVTNTLDTNGNLKSSTTFKTNVPSIPPFTTNMNMWMYSASGATNIEVYITSGASGTTTAGTFYLSNGATIAAPGWSHNYTGLTNGTTYYTGAAYNPTTQAWTVLNLQSSPLSAAQLQSLFEDGFVAFMAQQYLAAGANGTGGGAGCPAVGQMIETKEAGFVPAECVRQGYHVRHPDGGWREVYHAGKPTPALIYDVTFDTETVSVDASHLFERKIGSDRWVNVQDLRPGDRFDGARGRSEIVVLSVAPARNGLFVPLHVDGYRYTLGETISHNIKVAP